MDQEPHQGNLLRYAGCGVEFGVIFAVFAGGGLWLDRRLGAGLEALGMDAGSKTLEQWHDLREGLELPDYLDVEEVTTTEEAVLFKARVLAERK